MTNKLLRFQTAPTFILGMATLLWLPGPARAQSTTTPNGQQDLQPARQHDRQVGQNDDDIARRDLARFDQFLDSHRDDAQQLRKTPALVDDPQYLQSHPQLNTYLQDHPSVKQEISQRPDTFMRLEDRYDRDHDARDRDAGGPNHDADRRDDRGQDRDVDRRDSGAQDRDADRRDAARRSAERDANPGDAERDAHRRDLATFDRFLDGHHEIAEQVRKDPSLADNREFVQNHPPLQDFLRDNPGVRDQLRQDPNAFMHQEDRFDRNENAGDRGADRGNRDGDRRDLAEFDHFLDRHHEIAEQVRKDPSLADNREFVQNHPALQDFLQNNPGVREQLRQDPNAFMHQEGRYEHDRDANNRDRDG